MYNRQENRETTNKIAQARLFRIRFLNGLKRITDSTILTVITTIIIIGELYYTYSKVYMDSVFHDRFLNGLCFGCFMFVFSVLDAYLISRLGSPIIETVTHTASFNQIGLYNRSHQTPQIINKKEKDGVWTYEYFANGLPLSDFVDRKADIEAGLNKVIIDIKQGKDRSRIIVKAIAGDNQLPEKVVWDDSFLCRDNGVLIAGISESGFYTIDFDTSPHLSINGQSGCGKSVLLSCLLHQIKAQDSDSEIYLADFKSLMDFSKYEREQYNCVTDRKVFKSILNDLCNEMDRREKMLSAEYCNDVGEYNNKHKEAPLHRIIIASDEISAAFMPLNSSKEEKALVTDTATLLSLIAQKGRATWMNLILSTQRASADVIPGGVKSNFSLRMCGRASEILSRISVDHSRATEIPASIKGRFVDDNETFFQGFYYKDDDLSRLDYRISSPKAYHVESEDDYL